MQSESIQVDFIWECSPQTLSSKEMKTFFNDLLICLGLGNVELAVLVTDDQKMKEFNRKYRGKEGVTDVLSFPNPAKPPPGTPRHLGDIVICRDQAERQAKAIGNPVDREIRFLCLHGLLHLLGYDHETDDGEMLRYQSQIKKQLAAYF